MAGALTRRLITAVHEGRVRKVETPLQRGAQPVRPGGAVREGETGHAAIVAFLEEFPSACAGSDGR